jgi:predicted DNA-binding transcriptional regulator YafY
MAKSRKLSTHSMIERMIFINNKISEGKYPNTSKLSKELEVSIATISRDIEFLRNRLNAPIAYDSYHKGYFYTVPYNLIENLA